jgi:hypothetical protein
MKTGQSPEGMMRGTMEEITVHDAAGSAGTGKE